MMPMGPFPLRYSVLLLASPDKGTLLTHLHIFPSESGERKQPCCHLPCPCLQNALSITVLQHCEFPPNPCNSSATTLHLHRGFSFLLFVCRAGCVQALKGEYHPLLPCALLASSHPWFLMIPGCCCPQPSKVSSNSSLPG